MSKTIREMVIEDAMAAQRAKGKHPTREQLEQDLDEIEREKAKRTPECQTTLK